MFFKWYIIFTKILGEKNVRGHLCLSQFQALPNDDYLQMCRESIVHLSNELNIFESVFDVH